MLLFYGTLSDYKHDMTSIYKNKFTHTVYMLIKFSIMGYVLPVREINPEVCQFRSVKFI